MGLKIVMMKNKDTIGTEENNDEKEPFPSPFQAPL
jgi:hypothetical protein